MKARTETNVRPIVGNRLQQGLNGENPTSLRPQPPAAGRTHPRPPTPAGCGSPRQVVGGPHVRPQSTARAHVPRASKSHSVRRALARPTQPGGAREGYAPARISMRPHRRRSRCIPAACLSAAVVRRRRQLADARREGQRGRRGAEQRGKRRVWAGRGRGCAWGVGPAGVSRLLLDGFPLLSDQRRTRPTSCGRISRQRQL